MIFESWNIAKPPRAPKLGSAMVLLATGVMSFGFLYPITSGTMAAAATVVILSVSMFNRYVLAIHLSLLALLFLMTYGLGTSLGQWPFHILVPLLFYGFIIVMVPGLRNSIGWLKTGRFDAQVLKLGLATTIASAIALLGWVIWTNPDISHHLELIPELPIWLYPLAGLGFAISNAIMEEIVFRGVVMEATDGTLGDSHISVIVQAVPFAAFHYMDGFPNGLIGFVMVLAYGMMLGGIRRISRGLLAPIMVHVAADVTIFSILVAIFFQN